MNKSEIDQLVSDRASLQLDDTKKILDAFKGDHFGHVLPYLVAISGILQTQTYLMAELVKRLPESKS